MPARGNVVNENWRFWKM